MLRGKVAMGDGSTKMTHEEKQGVRKNQALLFIFVPVAQTINLFLAELKTKLNVAGKISYTKESWCRLCLFFSLVLNLIFVLVQLVRCYNYLRLGHENHIKRHN